MAVLAFLSVGAWESYWRSQGYTADLDDDKNLWSWNRSKLDKASADDVALLGSSRVLFDIQLDAFETQTGKKPIMLACAGGSPLPVLKDIVEQTAFKGTLIIGVTPPLFFSTTFPQASPWKRPQSRIDYYYNRTYAQRLNYMVSFRLQQQFAMLSANEEQWSNDIDFKALLRNVQMERRTSSPQMPPFYNFSTIDEDRNTKMLPRVYQDTAFANSIIKVWGFMGKSAPPPDKASTIAFFLDYAKQYTERGGKIILVRCPSEGGFRMGEKMVTPRDEFWGELLEKSQLPGYHFEDYPQLQYPCPEWSHLNAEDAYAFTTELTKLIQQDGYLTNFKTE